MLCLIRHYVVIELFFQLILFTLCSLFLISSILKLCTEWGRSHRCIALQLPCTMQILKPFFLDEKWKKNRRKRQREERSRRTERKMGRHRTKEVFPYSHIIKLFAFIQKHVVSEILESPILHFVLSMTRSWKLLNGSLRCNARLILLTRWLKNVLLTLCVGLMIFVLYSPTCYVKPVNIHANLNQLLNIATLNIFTFLFLGFVLYNWYHHHYLWLAEPISRINYWFSTLCCRSYLI